MDGNLTCVNCSLIINNCVACSQGSTPNITKCDKCLNNLKYNETFNKCGCENGYRINSNKTCEKIPDPDPIPPTPVPDDDDFNKIMPWLLLGLGVVCAALAVYGAIYCVRKRMKKRR